jgi:hypothetical protein
MQQVLPSDMESLVIEPGLHQNPDRLRDALQRTIDEITAHTETIIIGYGLCSMGVIGLKAINSTLVFPRMDDCIAIFLGSRRIYREILNQEPGTYFLSKGWIDAGITIVDEFNRMEERYGKERAERVMKWMLHNYKRLVFIDMGYQNQEKYRKFSRMAAKRFNLNYHEIKGTCEFIRKMCNGPWDRGFVAVPPGHTVRLEDFGLDRSGKQQPSSLSIGENRVKEARGLQPNQGQIA